MVLRAMTSPAVNVICPDAGAFVDPRMPPPTEEQVCFRTFFDIMCTCALQICLTSVYAKFIYLILNFLQVKFLRQILLSGLGDHVAR